MKMADAGYNQRLFAGGLRKHLHTARFVWMRSVLERLQPPPRTILELGCFDGKTLNFLPTVPDRYVGLDVSEKYLKAAARLWGDREFANFRLCTGPEDLGALGEVLDVSICMETLEHVPPAMMEPYIQQLFSVTTRYVLVTVPNEKGVVFLGKYAYKTATGQTKNSLPVSEVWHSTMGRLHKVRRDGHRGFDYSTVIDLMARYGRIVSVSGIPFPSLPLALNTQIGIVAAVR